MESVKGEAAACVIDANSLVSGADGKTAVREGGKGKHRGRGKGGAEGQGGTGGVVRVPQGHGAAFIANGNSAVRKKGGARDAKGWARKGVEARGGFNVIEFHCLLLTEPAKGVPIRRRANPPNGRGVGDACVGDKGEVGIVHESGCFRLRVPHAHNVFVAAGQEFAIKDAEGTDRSGVGAEAGDDGEVVACGSNGGGHWDG